MIDFIVGLIPIAAGIFLVVVVIGAVGTELNRRDERRKDKEREEEYQRRQLYEKEKAIEELEKKLEERERGDS